MTGFKPQEVIALLKIGSQRFRYWRCRLDPNPTKSKFSARDVFAYRIIKFLIEKEGVTVKELQEQKDIGKLFNWCALTSMDQAMSTMLLLNLDAQTIEFVSTGKRNDNYNLGFRSMVLHDVVKEHEYSLDNFGL